MELSQLILHVYPWWEMQRVRELSLRSRTLGSRKSNEWRHTPGLVDHDYRGVTTPNCDTLYSGAWLDLDGGPILIDLPETDLPYWSIAVMDLNTDNIAIMGSRFANSRALLVCTSDYAGPVPDGARCVRSASKLVWLLARYLIGNDAGVAQAEALRRSVRLGHLGSADDATSVPRVPLIEAKRHDAQNFWEVTRRTLLDDPGLRGPAGSSLRQGLDALWPQNLGDWSALAADAQARFSDAFTQLVQRVTANNSGNMQTRSHWRYPGSDIGNFGSNAMYRAEVSLWGLGALPTDEVIYVSAVVDAQGAPLLGAHVYRFRIPPEGIPAKAFWSLTMYEVDPFGGMYFTANPLKRYAIGDRTPGLHRNDDGSIDLWLTHTAPSQSAQLANWLPAPPGEFRVMIRAYAPTEDFQSGAILPPALEKVPH